MKYEYARLLRAADAVVALIQSGEPFDTDNEESITRTTEALDELELATELCHRAGGVEELADTAARAGR